MNTERIGDRVANVSRREALLLLPVAKRARASRRGLQVARQVSVELCSDLSVRRKFPEVSSGLSSGLAHCARIALISEPRPFLSPLVNGAAFPPSLPLAEQPVPVTPTLPPGLLFA